MKIIVFVGEVIKIEPVPGGDFVKVGVESIDRRTAGQGQYIQAFLIAKDARGISYGAQVKLTMEFP
jgi:hypothetical protein